MPGTDSAAMTPGGGRRGWGVWDAAAGPVVALLVALVISQHLRLREAAAARQIAMTSAPAAAPPCVCQVAPARCDCRCSCPPAAQPRPAPAAVSWVPVVRLMPAFTQEECERIIAATSSLQFTWSRIGRNATTATATSTASAAAGGEEKGGDEDGETRAEVRATLNSQLDKSDPRFAWVYERILHHIAAENNQSWRFRLPSDPASPAVETIQVLTYDAKFQGHYSWHLDFSPARHWRRLSATVQLSDPRGYEGGELQFMTSATPTAVPKTQGCITAFPAFALHRVRPVTRGTRHSLVVWLAEER